MRFSILFIFLCGVISANCQRLEISKIADDVYVYTTYQEYKGSQVPSNSMYVITKEGAILIDTPWDTTQVRPLIDSIWKKHKKKIIVSISTHFHEDRTGGVDYLESIGVKTYASSKTIQLCEDNGMPTPHHSFVGDTIFTPGEHLIRTYYPGAGHTTDNIVVWIEKDRIVFGGCLVKSVEATSLGNIADANIAEWPASVQNVIKEFPDRKFVIPGHQSWEDGRSLEHTIKLLKDHKVK